MEISQVLAITAVTLSFLSICACTYVLITSYEKAGLKCPCTCLQTPEFEQIDAINNSIITDSTTLPMLDMTSSIQSQTTLYNLLSPRSSNLMIDIIFWMVVTDGLHSISIFINWFPSLSQNIPFYSRKLCMIVGITGDFFVIQSPCWHVLLAFHLFSLLTGCCGTDTLNRNKKYHIAIICFFVPALVILLPCFIDGSANNAYGVFDNLSDSDEECWVKSKPFQLVYVVFILGSLVIHYVVVLVALYKYFAVYSGLRVRYWIIVITLFRFVFVFSIIRFFPGLERIMELIYDHPPATWLIMAHHIGISSLGIGDGFVWYLNQRSKQYGHRSENESMSTTSKGLRPNNANYNKFVTNDDGGTGIAQTPDQIHFYSPTPKPYKKVEKIVKKKRVIMFRGIM